MLQHRQNLLTLMLIFVSTFSPLSYFYPHLFKSSCNFFLKEICLWKLRSWWYYLIKSKIPKNIWQFWLILSIQFRSIHRNGRIRQLLHTEINAIPVTTAWFIQIFLIIHLNFRRRNESVWYYQFKTEFNRNEYICHYYNPYI